MFSTIDKKIEQMIKYLKKNSTTRLFSLENFEYVKCDGYKTDNAFPESGWEPLSKDKYFRGVDRHYWLRTTFNTPRGKE